MKYYIFVLFSSLLFLLASCDDGGSSTTNNNTTNNVNNTNNTGCVGDAPLADLQEGVCVGAVKVCSTSDGTNYYWIEPDYSAITDYEENEVSCDGLDNDCDGSVDEDLLVQFYRDGDSDNHGLSTDATMACSAPAGFVTSSDDCDDTDDTVSPSGTEVCDGKDNNCDNSIDEGLLSTFYRDADTDGHGDTNDATEACSAPAGYVESNDDCDDQDINNFPGNSEICDGQDNNCDGLIDEGLQGTYYRDADNDGHGNTNDATESCGAPAGYVASNDDCDDGNGARFPGNPEVCDGIDNNCDANIDEGLFITWYHDTDSDGHGNPADSVSACATPVGYVLLNDDCDDTNGARFPGNPEVCDTIDNDCNPLTPADAGLSNTFYRDVDGDGYASSSTTDSTTICSSTAPLGYATYGGDCDDGDNEKYPTNSEVCDGKDNDCNGFIDEGLLNTYYRDQDGDSHGLSTDSTAACTMPSGYVTSSDDCDDGDAERFPGNPEVCDDKDNNCNSVVDEGVLITYYRDVDGDGYGIPSDTVYACSPPTGYVDNQNDCDDTTNTIFPTAPELCNGIDDDCDTVLDNGLPLSTFYVDGDGDNYGDPLNTVQACAAPAGYIATGGDCVDSNANINPGELDICNLTDDDCDGVVDAGTCDPNASCYDNSGTQSGVCVCNAGYVEDPGNPGSCVQAKEASPGDIAITEIMIEPSAVDFNHGQYFEFINTTDATIIYSGLDFTVDGVTYSLPGSPLAYVGPGEFKIVARDGSYSTNGNVNVDVIFSSMPIMDTAGGTISIKIPGSPSTLIDSVTFDSTWTAIFVAGHALTLSNGAIDGTSVVTLNDLHTSWCASKPSQYNGTDYGTPGALNEGCLVESCGLLEPLHQVIQIGQSTDVLSGQVYEPGVTEPAGGSSSIIANLGYGTRHSQPDSTWTWFDVPFTSDGTAGDIYSLSMTPEYGVWDYAFRFSIDGGLSWRNCDSGWSSVYDHTLSGVLTVSGTDCVDGGTECSDCIDNNGDGLIDGMDPTCISSDDDAEGGFETDIPGDNPNDITGYHDCFIDGNSGSGDDECELDPCCLIGNNDQYCIDNPPTDCYASPHWDAQNCEDSCEPHVPVGCDCWGCCTICVEGVCDEIFTAPTVSVGCTVDTFSDPSICIRCTPSTECGTPCDPDNCILCPGMTEDELPDHCTGNTCPNGMDTCGGLGSTNCGVGYYCSNGCCLPNP